MSLLTTASIWNNDNIVDGKKRISTMRKTAKMRTNMNDEKNIENSDENKKYDEPSPFNSFKKNTIVPNDFFSDEETVNNQNMEEVAKYNEFNTKKITELLSNMEKENDGNKLANFEPLTKPEINKKTEINGIENLKKREYFSNDLLPKTLESNNKIFIPNDLELEKYSNYTKTYNPALNKPYYSKMGIDSQDDTKLMEKINYMIHLLEEQQNEKTANITEEMILYVFLGVFVIFTVDSFTKIGKYVR